MLDGYEHEFLSNVAADPSTSGFSGLDVPGIGQALRKGDFDAVLVNGWNYKAAWQTIWASKQLGLPVLTRGDSHLHTPRSRLKNWVKEISYPLMLRAFDGFLDVGQWSREYYLHYGAQQDRVFHVPHVIDETSFLPTARAACSLNAMRFAQLGTYPLMRPYFCSRASSLRRKIRWTSWELSRSRLAQAPESWGSWLGMDRSAPRANLLFVMLDCPVTFAGFLNQSEIIKAYIAADCLVLPSRRRNLGNRGQ